MGGIINVTLVKNSESNVKVTVGGDLRESTTIPCTARDGVNLQPGVKHHKR